ncbi:hypothetical protein ACJX0J_012427, partial [Zea mays]
MVDAAVGHVLHAWIQNTCWKMNELMIQFAQKENGNLLLYNLELRHKKSFHLLTKIHRKKDGIHADLFIFHEQGFIFEIFSQELHSKELLNFRMTISFLDLWQREITDSLS